MKGLWKSVCFLVLTLSLAGGCTQVQPPTPEPVLISGSIAVSGVTRTYQYHLPANYGTARNYPMVMILHGGIGSGENVAQLTGFNTLADEKGFIAVYPDGLDRSWNDGRNPDHGSDDVAFINALVSQLNQEFKVPNTHVFAAGISNGGFMVQRLACESSQKFAAVASVAATMPERIAAACLPAAPVSVLFIHGSQDPLVPVEGGEVKIGQKGKILSLAESLKKWAIIDQCSNNPLMDDIPDSADDGTRTRRETYSSCKTGRVVQSYLVEGGGHTWPGGAQYLGERLIGRTSRDFSATRVIWDFFEAHPKPTPKK